MIEYFALLLLSNFFCPSRKASRKYNNLFSFMAMGVSGPEAKSRPKLREDQWQNVPPSLPGNMRGTVRWYDMIRMREGLKLQASLSMNDMLTT